MENVSHYNSTANTSTNQLQFYHCSLLGDVFQWQNEHLTASVYTSSLLGAIASNFLFPFTTLANIFVLVAFLKARALRLNRTNMIMSSLSITDLTVGIIVHPLQAGSLTRTRWYISSLTGLSFLHSPTLCLTLSGIRLECPSCEQLLIVISGHLEI